MSGSDDSGIALSVSHERNIPNGESTSEEATMMLPGELESSKSDSVPANVAEHPAIPAPETAATESHPPSVKPETDCAGGQANQSVDAKDPDTGSDAESVSSGSDVNDHIERWRRRRDDMEERIKLGPKRVRQANQYNKILEERLALLEESTTLFEQKLRRLIEGEEVPLPPPTPVKDTRRMLEPELKFRLSKDLKHDEDEKLTHQIDVFVGDSEVPKADRFLRRKRESKTAGDDYLNDGASLPDPTLEHSSASSDERRFMEEMAKLKSKHLPSRIRLNESSITHLFRKFFTGDGSDVDNVILRPFKPLLHNREEIFNIMSDVVTALTNMIKHRAEKEAAPASRPTDLDEKSETVQPDEAQPKDAQPKDVQRDGVQSKESGEATSNPQGEDEEKVLAEERTAPDAISSDEWNTVLTELELFDENNGCNGSELDGWPTLSEVEKSFKCIKDLFDNYLLPSHVDFRERKAKKVRFCDLWHLFHTGDLVVTKRSTNLDGTESQARLGMRVLMTSGGRRVIMPKLPAPVFQSPVHLLEPTDKIEAINGINPFCIYAYYLDFNGSRLVPVRRRMIIAPYHGERNMLDLDVIPMEYTAGVADMLEERGKRFIESVTAPIAPYVDCKGLELVTREELNDKVIVDMKGYFGTNSGDIPSFREPEEVDLSETSNCRQGMECSYLCSTCYHRTSVVHDQVTDLEAYQEYIDDKPVFNPLSGTSNAGPIDPSDFTICHYRVFAYKLRSREWVQVNVKDLEKPPETEKGRGFDKLVLSEDHKHILESQVREHFRKRVSQAATGSTENDMDLVRGKGQGLIILLHGAPGVGKTCTAECIADLVEKPLYPITCGDLGSSANDVEANLKKHFTLASRWDCVMLLDEADVFLAKRVLEDLQRNSIVSVFLRMLEYYKGLLFLTTNRVGTFDEAFTSRVHISLFYPDFDKETTLKVWRTFINQTRHVLASNGRSNFDIAEDEIMKFAEKHYDRNEQASWNGRQIRNAFHTAVAMAEFGARNKKTDGSYDDLQDPTIKVGKAEFKKIAKTAEEFEEYMEDTMNGTFRTKAYKAGLRKDQKVKREKPKEKTAKKKKKPSKSKKKSESSSGSESEDDDDSDSD